MLKKLFYLIFTAALIISIVESVYLYNYATKSTDDILQNTSCVPSSSAELLNVTSKVSPTTQKILNDGYWNYLQGVGRESISSLKATITCRGTIAAIGSKPGYTPDQHRFEKSIKLDNATKDCIFLVFDAYTLNNTKFVENNNGKDSEIKFEDLKKGDTIESVATINLLIPQNDNDAKNLIQSVVTKK